jgi:phosphoethanolamine N-methyltransferase
MLHTLLAHTIGSLLLLSASCCMGTTEEGALTGYTQEAADLLEFVYGDGMLEMGGTKSIDDMFRGIDLDGKYILDIGSGSGGVDTYLAQKYAVKILGVEPELILVERATQRAEKLKGSFQGSVVFEQLRNHTNLTQYNDNTFDIVMSRGTILHVSHADKKHYFAEMLRVLKPGGQLVIDDWMHTSPFYSPKVKEMMEVDGIPYHLLTPTEYVSLVKAASFIKVSLRDTTNEAFDRSADTYERIETCKDELTKSLGEDMYLFASKSWALQKDAFQQRELLTGIVTARKAERAT